jgi:uncharacterized membrane protein YjjP (DUF1212 family)|tara:strand:+ start:70 stop:276 length:207 start_codon:yes stop_codon:yes gene_type:complete
MNKVQEKFTEMFKDNHIDELTEIDRILSNVENHGLVIEVVYTALKEMKENPNSSPLLALQIASEDWDC